MDSHRIATHSNATLDVVLRTIGIVHQMRLPIERLMIPVEVAKHQRVEKMRVARRISIGIFGFTGVAENHHVARSRIGVSRKLLVAKRNRRTVGELEPQQKVARMQRIFHRSARNLERLNHILNHNQRERHRDNDFPKESLHKLLPRKRLVFLFHTNPQLKTRNSVVI